MSAPHTQVRACQVAERLRACTLFSDRPPFVDRSGRNACAPEQGAPFWSSSSFQLQRPPPQLPEEKGAMAEEAAAPLCTPAPVHARTHARPAEGSSLPKLFLRSSNPLCAARTCCTRGGGVCGPSRDATQDLAPLPPLPPSAADHTVGAEDHGRRD